MEFVKANTKTSVLDPERQVWKTWDVFPGRLDVEPDPEHIEVINTAFRGSGAEHWNDWREAHPTIRPNLAGAQFQAWKTPEGAAGVDLSGFDLSGCLMDGCSLPFANLHKTNLAGAQLRECLFNQATIFESDFSGADMTQTSLTGLRCVSTRFIEADLSRTTLHASKILDSNFDRADLEGAEFDGAEMGSCTFIDSRLRSARFGASDLTGCDLRGADLSGAHFVKTNLRDTDISGSRVYAVNCWDSDVPEQTLQRGLIVTRPGEPTVSVDDMRMAQFVHLLLTNENLLTVIQTVGERAVLLLGRFGGGGLEVLQAVGDGLRDAGYLPMIFEFDRPEDRTYTDVIRTLAGLASFVVVDLSGPSVPQELYSNVPHLKIPFVPILEAGRQPYSMFVDLLEYDWVLEPIVEFETVDDLVDTLKEKVIDPAEERIAVRRRRLNDIYGAE